MNSRYQTRWELDCLEGVFVTRAYCLFQTVTRVVGWPFASAPLAVMAKAFPSFDTTVLLVMTTWPDFLNWAPYEFPPERLRPTVSAPLSRSGRPDPVIG